MKLSLRSNLLVPIAVVSALAVGLYPVGTSEAVMACVNARSGEGDAISRGSPVHHELVFMSRRCWGVFFEANDKTLVGAGTIGLFIVTSVLALYTYRLFRATQELATDARVAALKHDDRMSRSLELSESSARAATEAAQATAATVTVMRDTAHRQLRAYVLLADETQCEPYAGGAEWPHIQIVFRNFGSTPAHDITVSAIAGLRPPFCDDAMLTTADQEPISRGWLGAGDKRKTMFHHAALTPEEIESLERGTLTFMMEGAIHYRDVFGEVHRTTFRYQYNFKESRLHSMPFGSQAD